MLAKVAILANQSWYSTRGIVMSVMRNNTFFILQMKRWFHEQYNTPGARYLTIYSLHYHIKFDYFMLPVMERNYVHLLKYLT